MKLPNHFLPLPKSRSIPTVILPIPVGFTACLFVTCNDSFQIPCVRHVHSQRRRCEQRLKQQNIPIFSNTCIQVSHFIRRINEFFDATNFFHQERVSRLSALNNITFSRQKIQVYFFEIIEYYTSRSIILNGNYMLSTVSNIDIFPFYKKSEDIYKRESKALSHCEMVVTAVIIGFMLDTDVRIPLPCSNAEVRRQKLSDKGIEIVKKKKQLQSGQL